ncbi:MAG: Gfo/Idh/MocA family oxidoreductase [Robiginitalea sp.]
MSWTRREALLGLGSIPVLGAVWWAGAAGTTAKKREREAILEQLNIQPSLPSAVPGISGQPVRVGIIGFGIRGEQLCRSLGFATDEWIAAMEEEAALAKLEGRPFTALEDFRNQDPLNLRIVGVCDVFDIRAEKAVRSFSTPEQPVKRYTTYKDMIQSGEVEAVVIATPDHWHAPMSIEALRNNVHVYVEKPMTHTLSETYELREAARNSKAVFQVGHQHPDHRLGTIPGCGPAGAF